MLRDPVANSLVRLSLQDLGLAWTGTMPVPQYSADGRPPKRSTLAADVIDLWNASFFRMRGVEVILYKGRERRSGRYAGTVDMNLPGFDKFDVSSPSESDDDDLEDDDHNLWEDEDPELDGDDLPVLQQPLVGLGRSGKSSIIHVSKAKDLTVFLCSENVVSTGPIVFCIDFSPQ